MSGDIPSFMIEHTETDDDDVAGERQPTEVVCKQHRETTVASSLVLPRPWPAALAPTCPHLSFFCLPCLHRAARSG